MESIKSRGEYAPETIWMATLAMRNPDIQQVLRKQMEATVKLLHLDPDSVDTATVLAVLTGVYISGLNLGLTLEAGN